MKRDTSNRRSSKVYLVRRLLLWRVFVCIFHKFKANLMMSGVRAHSPTSWNRPFRGVMQKTPLKAVRTVRSPHRLSQGSGRTGSFGFAKTRPVGQNILKWTAMGYSWSSSSGNDVDAGKNIVDEITISYKGLSIFLI